MTMASGAGGRPEGVELVAHSRRLSLQRHVGLVPDRVQGPGRVLFKRDRLVR
ncbi:hypothetical protein [Streptomyces sp. NBC_00391]|uniref:hypothetical protein n=1 Tax=Streptomyces sp. NBC_00391 TaxID=2903647 RepID=UPI002E240895